MQKQTSTHGCQSDSPLMMKDDSRLTCIGFLHLSCFLLLTLLFSLAACSRDLEYGSIMSNNLILPFALREIIGNSNCY